MAITTASSFKLTLATVKRSVDSFPLSLKFMKKLVPISISTVLSQRLNSEPGNFHHLHYGETDYYVVKKTPKDPKFKEIFNSLHGIVDAIESQYLKELHLIIVEGNSDRILEKYKYKFFYNKEGLEISETKKIKKQIFVTVTKHLTDLKELQNMSRLPEDSRSHIFLTYYDNTPKNYEPYFFEEGSDKSHLIREILYNEKRISFQKVSTGFHTVSCSVRIPEPFLRSQIHEIDENENMEEDNTAKKTNDNENQNKNSTEEFSNPLGETTISIPSNGGIDESWDLTMCDNSFDFNCICGMNESINRIKTVMCSVCHFAFHYPCVSVFMNTFPEKFVCWDCADSIPGVEPTNVALATLKKEQRETTATRFLIICCILESKSYPEDIINKLSVHKRKRVVSFLEKHNLISFHGNGQKTILDFKAVEKCIDCFNTNNDFEEDSQILPESEEPAPKRMRII